MKTNNFELKKLKFHEDMSEETPCFSADLYENGKLVAHVSNDGHGGNNNVYPANGLTYKDVEHLTSFRIDCEIMELAEHINFVNKHQTKNFVLRKGKDFFTVKFQKPITLLKKYGNYKFWVKSEKEKFKKEGFEVLNTNL
jgi:hypothetical protein